MNIITNPIFLGIMTALIVYRYMAKKAEKENKKVDYVTPGLIGLIVGFLASNYFGQSISLNPLNTNSAKTIMSSIKNKDMDVFVELADF